jgi:enterochelin esterase-like enzyme
MRRIILFHLVFVVSICTAQQVNNKPQLPVPENSQVLSSNLGNAIFPRVLPDNSLIFKFYAPLVSSMKVVLKYNEAYEMVKDGTGVWSVTTPPMEPGFHYYYYLIDDVKVSDPNGKVYFGSEFYSSAVDIPEQNIDFYDIKDVPHGEIRSVIYYSNVTHSWRSLNIYIPYSYKQSDRKYPVLYLQHGGGENEQGWVDQGKTANILDNLIVEGKAEEMLVVISNGNVGNNSYNSGDMQGFTDEIIHNIIPFIESNYRVIPDADHRALAGLSMGGGQSFYIGLRNPDVFSHVGVFSCGVFGGTMMADVPSFDAEKAIPGIYTATENLNKKLNLLYISCGEQDTRIESSRRIAKEFHDKGLKVEFSSFPGDHEWQVWRKSLHDFAPRLFKTL